MNGYIYIAWDITKPNQCKVGKTTRPPSSRISETTNPDYELYHSFDVGYTRLDFIEQDIHAKLVKSGVKRRVHRSTGKPSEWFDYPKEQADEFIASYLENAKSKEKQRLEAIAERQKANDERLFYQSQAKRAIEDFKRDHGTYIQEVVSNYDKLDELRKIEYDKACSQYAHTSFTIIPMFLYALSGLLLSAFPYVIFGVMLEIENAGWICWGLCTLFYCFKEGFSYEETGEEEIAEHMFHWDKNNNYEGVTKALEQIASYKQYLQNFNYKNGKPVAFDQYVL